MNESTKSASYRSWYEQNKKLLLERRKLRYQNDPEYREQIKRSRRKRALVQKQLRRLNPKKRDGSQTYKVDSPSGLGSYVSTFYLMQGVTAHLGVSREFINRMEKAGIFPPIIYRTKGGWRLRSEDEVEAIKASLLAARISRAKDGCINLNHEERENLRREVEVRYKMLEVGILKERFIKQ